MQPIRTSEKLVLLVIGVALTAAYAYWIYLRYPLHQADSAFFVQMLDRMAQTGHPVSQVAEAVDHLFNGYKPYILNLPAEELCQLPLSGPGPNEFNYFRWHRYYDLYLYIPLVKLLGGELAMSLLTAVDFLMVIAGAYILLRKSGVAILSSALIALLLAFHPVWSGGILGQFYGERLFIGPGFVFCALLLTGHFDSRWVPALSLLLTLTSERMGGVVGGLMIGSLVLVHYDNPREWWRRRLFILLALCYIAFSAVTIHLSEQPHYAAFMASLSLEQFVTNLKTYPGFATNLLAFLAINVIAWGIPALVAAWRGLLLALGLMVPNIVGNIGGAEKTGFVTHYHSTYFPVLAVAVCLSFACVYRRYPRWVPALFACWLGVAAWGYNFVTGTYDFNFTDVASRSLAYPFKDYSAYESQLARDRNELASYMDAFPNTRISTIEALMPVLSRHHSVAYYPLGLDDSDFIVIRQSAEPGKYAGAFSHLGYAESAKIDECLNQRLAAARYHVQKLVAGAAVLTRRPGESIGMLRHGPAVNYAAPDATDRATNRH